MSYDLKEAMLQLGKGVFVLPNIAKALGSIPAAMFIAQMTYWSERCKYPQKGVYKTKEEIFDEMAITSDVLDSVRKLLKKTGILTETKETWNGKDLVNRVYYRINGPQLTKVVLDYLQQQAGDDIGKTDVMSENDDTGKTGVMTPVKQSISESTLHRVPNAIPETTENRREVEEVISKKYIKKMPKSSDPGSPGSPGISETSQPELRLIAGAFSGAVDIIQQEFLDLAEVRAVIPLRDRLDTFHFLLREEAVWWTVRSSISGPELFEVLQSRFQSKYGQHRHVIFDYYRYLTSTELGLTTFGIRLEFPYLEAANKIEAMITGTGLLFREYLKWADKHKLTRMDQIYSTQICSEFINSH